MEEFFLKNQWVLILMLLWSLVWKGFALWKAAKNNHKWWFVVILIINSMGILELLYLFLSSKKFPVKEPEKT